MLGFSGTRPILIPRAPAGTTHRHERDAQVNPLQPVEGGECAPGEEGSGLGPQQGHEQHLVLEANVRLLLVAAPLQPKPCGRQGGLGSQLGRAPRGERAAPSRVVLQALAGSPWLRKATSSGGM